MRGITPRENAGTLWPRPDGRIEEGRSAGGKEYVRGKMEEEGRIKIDARTGTGSLEDR